MSLYLFLQNTTPKHNFGSDWNEIVLILFFVIIVTLILEWRKSKQKSFEEKIIKTISKNRILDLNFFDGVSSEDMKINIRHEIIKLNNKYRRQFIDLEKMEKLMEGLTLDNLQKLYQWFLYKDNS